MLKPKVNSSRFINEIKQLFLVYLISVFIRNIVVYIQTKNVKQNKSFDIICFAAHLFYFIFQASGLREREREREI